MSNIMQAISVIEGEMIKVVDENPDRRAQLKKFLNCKVFASLEHMRVEMELRYKAQQVFLTTNDQTKLHGYWVPCQAAY
jgi:tRNA/tmRNA/rRNA uracil-C5-methylase (TrmA/RlmC/RlmD family)